MLRTGEILYIKKLQVIKYQISHKINNALKSLDSEHNSDATRLTDHSSLYSSFSIFLVLFILGFIT